ncbi:hypothetical protein ACFSKU_00555 [Pontibacter silvestris]|uniref:Uncharacterized protein n=1 Tax=Pontibacter silvestris TaxID=2305183 RepID=A0ABW4WRJ9_9BACT|nr:hypothetical protein [Pontibacter silvestris]MCC9138145.1 hypothetical protein [Pontibacter silvestris]
MNRKYLVDTITREYLCIALKKGQEWVPNNQDSLQSFMSSRSSNSTAEAELLSGEFNDNNFFEKWIRNGTNFLFR